MTGGLESFVGTSQEIWGVVLGNAIFAWTAQANVGVLLELSEAARLVRDLARRRKNNPMKLSSAGATCGKQTERSPSAFNLQAKRMNFIKDLLSDVTSRTPIEK